MTARDSIRSTSGRRGNALLLVSGLLVMLTLIAAAYLSRSRAQRTTAAAIHDTVGDASRASMIVVISRPPPA